MFIYPKQNTKKCEGNVDMKYPDKYYVLDRVAEIEISEDVFYSKEEAIEQMKKEHSQVDGEVGDWGEVKDDFAELISYDEEIPEFFKDKISKITYKWRVVEVDKAQETKEV